MIIDDMFLIFASKTDCWSTGGTRNKRLIQAVIKSTHNQCLETKCEKNEVYPFKHHFYLFEFEVLQGCYYTDLSK